MRKLAAVVGLVALLGATGCGGDSGSRGGTSGGGDGAAALQVLQAASERTTETGSSRVALDVDVPQRLGGAGSGVSIDGEGVVDFEAKTSQLTLTVPAAGKLEVRQIGDVVYTKVPEAFAAQTGGKTWIKIDGATAQQSGLSDLVGGGNDPAQSLEYLRGVTGDVEEVGTETVRGEQTTRYRATVDLRKAAGAVPEDRRKAFEASIQQLGTADVPVEVWVDEDGRTRRVVTSIPVSAGSTSPAPSAAGDDVKVTVEFFEFGVDVDVQAPPAAEVGDLAELQRAEPAASTAAS